MGRKVLIMCSYDKRVEQLREVLAQQELEAMIVTQPENRRYLSGYTGTDGTLVLTQDKAILITDFRYTEQAEREAPGVQIVEASPALMGQELGCLVDDLGARRVGFESHHVTCSQCEEWKQAVQEIELVPLKDTVESLRQIKDEGELDRIRRAAAIGDAAMAHIRLFIKPGMTEKEVAWELESYMRTHGAEAVAFDTIVGSGPNGAMAHATVSDRAIQEGEPVVIDLGARVEGYNSDMTRTLFLGQPDERFQELYYLVLDAQMKALTAIRPGMTGREADALGRDVIEAAGYGKHFGHGLGHSVGLAIHEDPKAGTTSEAVLRPGNTLTVEPGIYITGWGGVRIEDLVVITETGVEILSKAGKGPVVMV
jgi:Xaa-Pro aminopeptidase